MGWNNIHDCLDAGFSWLGGDRRAFERYNRRSAAEDQARNQILTNQAYRRAHPAGPQPERKSVRFADPNTFGMRTWDTILARNRTPGYQRPLRAQRGADGYVDYLNYSGPSPARLSQLRRHGSMAQRQQWQQMYGLSDRTAGLSGGYYGRRGW